MKNYKSYAKNYTLQVKERNSEFHKAKVTTSKDSYEYCKQFYFDDIEIFESMFALFLNRSNNVIGWVKISQGGTTGTVMDVKLITKYAIEILCEGIILCHNHPSQNLKPSIADKEITKKTKEGLKYFDITLLDHIIIGTESYFSFADDGIL
jgi:DNA repair protein RadC